MTRCRAALVLTLVVACGVNLACASRPEVLRAAADELVALETRPVPEGSVTYVDCDAGAETPATYVELTDREAPTDPAEYDEFLAEQTSRHLRVWADHGWEPRSSGAFKRFHGQEVRATIDAAEGGYAIVVVMENTGLCN